MAGLQNKWTWEEDFIGGGAFNATSGTADVSPWVHTETSAAGTPTITRLDHGEATGTFAPGVAELAFDSTSEVQNVCLSFGDKLCFDIDNVQGIQFRVQQGQATVDSATSMAWGITGDRNDAIDSIAVAALFRIIGSNTVVVETDDGTNNNDDVSTGGLVLANSWKRFYIDLQNSADVRFFMDDSNDSLTRVAATTTFDMSNHTGGLQPFIQIQKTADTNTDTIEIDYVQVFYKR